MESKSDPLLPTLIWHHELHERLGEQLFFWRLSFASYARDQVRAGLRAAFARHEIKSVVAYELLGVHDLLLRTWLPEAVTPEVFQDTLLSELFPHGLQTCESFAVDYPVCHWPFAGDDGTSDPALADVRRILGRPTDIRDVDDGTASDAEVDRLARLHLLSRPRFDDPARPGIKFAIVVAGDPDHSVTLKGDDGFEARVITVVDNATTILQRSLYSGRGFGHFVILGRVPYIRYHDLHQRLIVPLSAAPIRDTFKSTVTTHVSGQRGFLECVESLTRSAFVVRTPAPLDSALVDGPGRVTEGEVIAGRFRVMQCLGAGGFGTVYRVFDQFESEERALKIFRTLGDGAAQRELAVLRRVQHPNVVRMFWGDRDPDTHLFYLVSEFVEGVPLEIYVRGHRAGELTDAQAVEIVRQMLDGLQALDPQAARREKLRAMTELSESEWNELRDPEKAAIVHRDVKPENVMLTRDATAGGETGDVIVKLIDFNIASPAGERARTDKGTPRYRPPDFVPAGSAWEPWIDLYAVGVVMYELLCGGEAHPYPQGNQGIVDPREFRPGLPSGLSTLLMRACSLDSTERFESAREMRVALDFAWSGVRDDSAGEDRR